MLLAEAFATVIPIDWQAVAAAVPFTIGIASLEGAQQTHKYADAFTQAESRAREIANALGVPYRTNYFEPGFLGPLADLYRPGQSSRRWRNQSAG